MSRHSSRTRIAGMVALLPIATLVVGCASEASPAVDPAAYRAELVSICVASSAERAALTSPADDAGVAAFALDVADVFTREADAARALQAPDDLDDDHRAFVQNTADQAARWTTIAATPTDDAARFGELQTDILELALGRDDLASAMGVDACRVAAE